MKNQLILGVLLCPFFSFAMETLENGPDVDLTLLDKVYDYTMQQNSQYCETPHNPLLIMISGCAGMGKTTLAKFLQENLHILRFNGDDTRSFLKQEDYFDVSLPVETKLGRILSCFSHFVSKVEKEASNKSIIFDESIDRQKPPAYQLVSDIIETYRYPKFVVRLKVSKEVALTRILQREHNSPNNTNHFKQHFEDYYTVYEKFNPDYVDFSLDNEGSSVEENSGPLIEKIKELVTPID